MSTKLEIADALDYNQLNQAYDEYCKKILSNKQILALIMKECVSEYKDLPVEEISRYIENDPQLNVTIEDDTGKIKGLNTEDRSIHGAVIKYDILFDAKLPDSSENETIGLFINIEAQNSCYTFYPLLSRAVYYCSRLLAGQKNRKGGFTHSNFKELKKVYSIWIVMNSSKQTEGVFNKYTIKEECFEKEYHFPIEEYDKLSVVMIYPNSGYDLNDQEHSLMEMLYILFKAKMTPSDKKCQLEKNYGIMMTKQIDEEVEEMCNLSQGLRAEGIKQGIKQGITQGIKQGIKQGITQGVVKGRIEMAYEMVIRMMKKTQKSANEVMDLLDIDETLRPEIAKLMNSKDCES